MYTAMYDDITLSLLPKGAAAYAGYVNGRWANFPALKAMFPKAHLLDISVFASGDATCLDVEAGDATIAEIYGWFKRQQARRVYRPVIYTSANNLAQLGATMTANGFPRESYRVWSAHYNGAHICGAATCGYNVGGSSVDGTQFTSTVLGHSLDESLIVDSFFAPAPPPPPPPHGVRTADGTKSLAQALTGTGTSVQQSVWLMARNNAQGFGPAQAPYIDAGNWAAKMPNGMLFYA